MSTENIVWAVAYVWRGMPDSVKLFVDRKFATDYIDNLRLTMPNEDEVSVFPVKLPPEGASEFCD